MRNLDYIVFFGYLVLTAAIGLYFTRSQKKSSDFFLAGRTMNWFPIGLSIMVTAFSAINYTAFSGEVFGHGLYVFLCLPVFIFVAIPVIKVIMPFYHSMQLYSVYDYLEKRFDRNVRLLGNILFIFWQLFWVATVIYVPCKVLSALTGYSTASLILIAGILATAYTMAGGIKAVIWTDVLQFFVLFGGVVLGIFFTSLVVPGGFFGIFKISLSGGLMKPFYPFDPQMFSFDPHIRITLWSCWIGTFTAFLARYGVDQVVVQRYFTAKSLKNAQRGFHLNYITAILVLVSLGILGFAVFAFMKTSGMPGSHGELPIDYFSQFVQVLPAGMTGLIIAGLFAATMSSLDSGINSLTTVFVVDIYQRIKSLKILSEMTANRLFTLIIGFIATVLALNVGRLGSIFEIANKVINGFGSPLMAIFILGMFSKRANSRGMIMGGIAGAAWSAYVSFTVQNLALHYYAVINLLGTLFLCYFFSLVFQGRSNRPGSKQLAWMYARRKNLKKSE
jgi:SSS family transporter